MVLVNVLYHVKVLFFITREARGCSHKKGRGARRKYLPQVTHSISLRNVCKEQEKSGADYSKGSKLKKKADKPNIMKS